MDEEVECPACSRKVPINRINRHLDRGCPEEEEAPSASGGKPVASFFTPLASRKKEQSNTQQQQQQQHSKSSPPPPLSSPTPASKRDSATAPKFPTGKVESHTITSKRPFSNTNEIGGDDRDTTTATPTEIGAKGPQHDAAFSESAAKKQKTNSSAVRLKAAMPLAERMRPADFGEMVGQEAMFGQNGVLRRMISADRCPSMLLWGPAGVGKTSCARLIAKMTKARFVELSGTLNGVSDCKKVFTEAKSELMLTGKRTILFVDEIHRLNRAQQDVFLAPVESGQITLIGATTENPSFKIQPALLSRIRTFTLQPLSTSNIAAILKRALDNEVSISETQEKHPDLIDEKFMAFLADLSAGDARAALNMLEMSVNLVSSPEKLKEIADDGSGRPPSQEDLRKALTKNLAYNSESHYDTISAFHKSIRGSDPDATLYYLGRMLQSGEDPLFISRRMVVCASEDVRGLADNTMLPLAMATHTAVQQIGMPEARINLAHCAVALALSPKSTRSYRGLNNAMALLEADTEIATAPIPLHLRNAPTRLMKNLGYGEEYKYPPDYIDGKVKQEYLPPIIRGSKFLEDRDLGTKRDPDLWKK